MATALATPVGLSWTAKTKRHCCSLSKKFKSLSKGNTGGSQLPVRKRFNWGFSGLVMMKNSEMPAAMCVSMAH